jgi:putative transposase
MEASIFILFSIWGSLRTDNAIVEGLNGRLRQECFNENWFMSLQDARSKIEAWQGFYNDKRPHSALVS